MGEVFPFITALEVGNKNEINMIGIKRTILRIVKTVERINRKSSYTKQIKVKDGLNFLTF